MLVLLAQLLLLLLCVLLYCCCCRSIAAVLLLPAAVRHRVPDGEVVAGSINLIPVFSSFHSNTIQDIFKASLGSTVAFTVSICLHPR